ncbi:unnamed protein product [Caenorhabditis angaria]|uniref:Reverse transcriptase domain-containing protein n=1 Tax=Caenorhabditis angaria TaxID=860376 RepID=A0A9P1N3Q5_9PELO|nr:unnamed protein product [Caenorhabditis angaria]
MSDYESEGKSFQRLEWIADVLTASIHQASVGDKDAIIKIVKRCPPPEKSAGDMCTQTDKPKRPYQAKPKPQNSPVEEEHIMAQYAKNRAKTFCKITKKESKQCEIPIAILEEHFKKTTTETNVSKETLNEMSSEVPETIIDLSIIGEFTPSEIKSALKVTKDTKPGVDGVHYHHLKWFDPDNTLLCKIFNACKEHRKIPEHWKEAETILLYKGSNSDPNKPDNWRPISLMPTIYKLYSSLWNRRIRAVKGIMSKCQRGFQERDGSNESIGILRTAIDAAKGTGGNLSIAWLDLTNAFGSVPHELIRHTLRAFGFPPELEEIISDMYDGACIRVRNKTETTNPILIKSGVKQGDPISPTLFNMCLELVIRRHLQKAKGHRCLKTNIKALAFADDMAILANSPTQLQAELENLDKDCTSLNLIFKPTKCASLTISEGKLRTRPLFIKGQQIRTLDETGTYKYLGVETGNLNRTSEMELLSSTLKDLEYVITSSLAPWQKLDCVKCFILPKLTYMYANATPKLSELREFSNMVMKAIKTIHSIPIRGSPLEYIQIPISKGGLGVLCPRLTALIGFLVSTTKKIWAKDPYIRKIYADLLQEVAEKETGKFDMTPEQLADYLNNKIQLNKKAFGFNVFTRVRDILKSLSKLKDSPLHLLEFTTVDKSLALKIQATPDSEPVIITEDKIGKLQETLKGKVIEAHLHRFLTEKDVKSKVVQVIQQDRQSNSFVRTGGKVSISAHKFVHRARLNLLTCNYNTYDSKHPKGCRRCPAEKETQAHILQSCDSSLGRGITERHNCVLYHVKEAIEKGSKKQWKLKIDKRAGAGQDRPDIQMESPDGKHIILADVRITYENGLKPLENAWKDKIEKYQHLVDYYARFGKKTTILPLVVGSLGTWYKPTTDTLVELGLGRGTIRSLKPELLSKVLEHSKNIYWQHIFGDKYVESKNPFAPEKPKGAAWKTPKPAQLELKN